ncbi:helix-turn-helix domain-containing protein [Flavobacterium sp. WC2429]|uniref:Helix-turn-helix domain-containing protein n=1 Tax=Flavobacterium sp. WC2429 TaxID=3234140 RepID=A0AB39WGD7_9FLAO
MDQEIDQQRINAICKMLLEMAEGNFTYRIPRTGIDDELEAVAVLVNWMAEEMKESVFHIGYSNPHQSYQYIAESTFMVDNKFIIKDFSVNVPELLGCTSNELLELDFTSLLSKESVSLFKTLWNDIVENKSNSTIISLGLVGAEKLSIPAPCTICNLVGSTEVMITFFSVNSIETIERPTQLKVSLTAEEQKIHNYLDVKSTQAVYDYILAHMDSAMPTLKELSRIFGTNEYKLKNGFKHVFKTTIQQFYNTERLKRAQLLIQYSRIPLKTIAVMAGFSTYPNFSRAFKIKFGYSPSDLERQSPV